MSKLDPAIEAHRQWLGFAQPVGLVVSPHALVAAQAHPDKNIAPRQEVLVRLTEPPDAAPDDAPRAIRDLVAFLTEFMGWQRVAIAGTNGGPPLPDSLTVAIPDRNEHLRPTYAVADTDDPQRWIMLIDELPLGTDLDRVLEDAAWAATPQARMERLLRDTDVPIGLHCNGTHLRLTYRPRGETPGYVTFGMDDLVRVDGRPLVAALHMLLRDERVFTLPVEQRLPAILAASRRYQNTVSTRLAEQVLVALSELLRGFQSADEFTQGQLLGAALREDPGHVYGGLLSTLMRLVFVLYTEDQGLMPTDSVYTEHYSVWKLFEQLREDDALYHDSMDQRYGAWGRLLALFRLIHDGAAHGNLRMPARGGRLFNPDTYPFLEGRPYRAHRSIGETLKPLHITDGVVFRVLEKLLVLDGERLSYRALDVEQIGSVYEAMMGFVVQIAKAPSLAIGKKHVVVDLQALLDAPGKDRGKALKEWSETELSAKAATALLQASTIDEIEAALERRRSPLTPHRVGLGGLYLQPTDERRRSGSNYTPRTLTQPIVQRTLEPILADLGAAAEPEQILALKVCDPAMGSGAFLVEACRQLSQCLVQAWERHQRTPAIPPDEDALLHARRLIAQQSLYGVDKNPYAVDLAKLSLWLVTFAKDHPFTFVDHALRNGDSLVGLSRQQITRFHWEPAAQVTTLELLVRERLNQALGARAAIHKLSDSDDLCEKTRLLGDADSALADARLLGDCLVGAFFGANKAKAREERRTRLEETAREFVTSGKHRDVLEADVDELAAGENRLKPFHWELEFPEVFSRQDGGFDAMVGNPPFLGGKLIAPTLGDNYTPALKTFVVPTKGSADLIAYFLLRVMGLVRRKSTVGLVATKTLVEGDTREVGLASLPSTPFILFSATSPAEWPGDAGVHYITLCLATGFHHVQINLDGQPVPALNSRLEPVVEEIAPQKLAQQFRASSGTSLLGEGFILEPPERDELLRRDARSALVIKRFMNGEDIVRRADVSPSRFVIDFGVMDLDAAKTFGAAFERVERLVRPQRERLSRQIHEHCYWRHWDKRTELYSEINRLGRIIVFPLVAKYVVFAIIDAPRDIVFSHKVGIIPSEAYAPFAILQSRLHVEWVNKYSSSRGETINFSISDCLNTFPLPASEPEIEAAVEFHAQRRTVLLERGCGLTELYNRFHDPSETAMDILHLRDLQDRMDRAALCAYDWSDIVPTHAFLGSASVRDDGGSRAKRAIRYRWPDALRDEVLARLLALNQQRAAEERALASPAPSKRPSPKRATAATRSPNQSALQLDLPGETTK